MRRITVHVVPNCKAGGWDVKRSDAQHASIRTVTKIEAIKVGRIISQRSGSGLIIHGQDGGIQRSD